MSNYGIIIRELVKLGINEDTLRCHLSIRVNTLPKITTYHGIWHLINFREYLDWGRARIRREMMQIKDLLKYNEETIKVVNTIKYNKDLK